MLKEMLIEKLNWIENYFFEKLLLKIEPSKITSFAVVYTGFWAWGGSGSKGRVGGGGTF